MKYLILVPDGAGDEKIEALGGKTPLEAAELENIDALAHRGIVGMVKTIPDGVPPGSDAANLSVMGYDPSVYLTGRSPLEAASIGIDMSDTDVAFRTNIVTLEGDGDYEDLIIADHSSGDITTEEAAQLIEAVNDAFADESIRFYTGVSYRHCMIVHNGSTEYSLTPPHDVLTQRVGDHLPRGEGSRFITDMMKKSYDILKDHPVNRERIKKGLNPANSLWIWGQGRKPALSSFSDKYGIKGAAISAVDLIKGIAICAGLESIDVEGATGTLNTNFEGKAKAAVEEFKNGMDFVYIHLEGPDECSHQGDMEGKIRCMESIDKKVLKPVVDYLREAGEEFRVLIVPDHRTPLAIRTHSADPVPFVIYDSRKEEPYNEKKCFSEKSGAEGMYFNSGFELADFFFEK
ncbi:MAG TPA: cofactor-independent phosphoglycerate mutase [Candidatus Copromorpha excrementigallinarum]|uniref:Cofactor-independent phosphoglycerate mutase n=1 Tax=Candidatus Allocopromorpha excrementigallinarum TaxID=2840742 RepID=A0A9D1I2X5_9FIRM|nr:cofactor-independent phosphoglycerate mutase [Candidatus Copromorpha excrementigallinarum]